MVPAPDWLAARTPNVKKGTRAVDRLPCSSEEGAYRLWLLDFVNGGAGGTRTPNPFQGSRFQGGVFIQPVLLQAGFYFNFTVNQSGCNPVCCQD